MIDIYNKGISFTVTTPFRVFKPHWSHYCIVLIANRVLIVGIIFQGRHELNQKGQIAPACFGINLIKNVMFKSGGIE